MHRACRRATAAGTSSRHADLRPAVHHSHRHMQSAISMMVSEVLAASIGSSETQPSNDHQSTPVPIAASTCFMSNLVNIEPLRHRPVHSIVIHHAAERHHRQRRQEAITSSTTTIRSNAVAAILTDHLFSVAEILVSCLRSLAPSAPSRTDFDAYVEPVAIPIGTFPWDPRGSSRGLAWLVALSKF